MLQHAYSTQYESSEDSKMSPKIFVALAKWHSAKTIGACTIKLFMAVIYGFSYSARVFLPGKPFQPSLMFAGKAGAYPRVEHLKGDSLG